MEPYADEDPDIDYEPVTYDVEVYVRGEKKTFRFTGLPNKSGDEIEDIVIEMANDELQEELDDEGLGREADLTWKDIEITNIEEN